MGPAEKLLKDALFWGFEKFGRYYSKYRAFVYDREDPECYGRLRLVVPTISGDRPITNWAWPSNNYAGKGYGSQAIPQKNELVWVEFEYGDVRKPLWSFGYFGKDEKPNDLKGYNKYWFKTPKGNLVLIDDDSSLIQVVSKDKIKLLKDQVSSEPAVLGDTLQSKLENLIDLLLQATTNTSLGPQPLFNILTQLQQLKVSLSEIKSQNLDITK